MTESKPLSKVDKNGRITIPAESREKLGIKVDLGMVLQHNVEKYVKDEMVYLLK